MITYYIICARYHKKRIFHKLLKVHFKVFPASIGTTDKVTTTSLNPLETLEHVKTTLMQIAYRVAKKIKTSLVYSCLDLTHSR